MASKKQKQAEIYMSHAWKTARDRLRAAINVSRERQDEYAATLSGKTPIRVKGRTAKGFDDGDLCDEHQRMNWVQEKETKGNQPA